jgi:hypothetical protein
MVARFSTSDVLAYLKILRKVILKYIIVMVFLFSISYLPHDEVQDIFSFRIKTNRLILFFALIYTISFLRYLLDFLLRKKIVFIGQCRLIHGFSGGDLDTYVLQLEMEGHKAIDVNGSSSLVDQVKVSEQFEQFEVSYSKYSKIILDLKRL